ncbi:MAG: glycoside hydrolase family 99-like domain-containing protein [Candidatus Cryptobacteroides sp.]
MKTIRLAIVTVLAAAMMCSCDKNQFTPPDWNYEIPQTALKAQSQLGTFYTIQTAPDWKSAQDYTPVLSVETDEENETTTVLPYNSTQDGILTAQFELAGKAGIDFFIIPWNNGTTEQNFLAAWEYYWTPEAKVKIAVNYNFSHLHLDSLEGEGENFDKVVDDFKALYTTLFSREWYYRMPDGRAVIIINGMASSTTDYEKFIPAFREAMKQVTLQMQEADPEAGIPDKALDFYIIGENTSNWCPPQTNQSTARHLDGNYLKKWVPSTYYERWYCFYPFTDMAWENWRNYAAGWGNDFVPCIFPEYYTSASSERGIERSAENWTRFCNVAKRNIGSQNIILINSWNDFTNDTALEPTLEYGETYLDITRKELKL